MQATALIYTAAHAVPAIVVAVWESREAAERYLTGAALRRAVDAALPQITRVMYEVISHK